MPPTCEVSKKIHVPPEQIAEFWRHWSQHMPFHPASASANRYPIGVSGDDAKYTLSGMKFIVVMVSSVLYKVKRDHAARRFWNFISNNNQRFEQLHAYLVLQPCRIRPRPVSIPTVRVASRAVIGRSYTGSDFPSHCLELECYVDDYMILHVVFSFGSWWGVVVKHFTLLFPSRLPTLAFFHEYHMTEASWTARD